MKNLMNLVCFESGENVLLSERNTPLLQSVDEREKQRSTHRQNY